MEFEYEITRVVDGWVIFRIYEMFGGWYIGTRKLKLNNGDRK